MLGRATGKYAKKHKKHKHHAKRHHKPYKKKKVALRSRRPGQKAPPPGPAHTVMNLDVSIRRNRTAGKAKNAIEACTAIPDKTKEGRLDFICAKGKNPRSAIGKALKKAGSAVARRTGTFAGMSGF